MSCIVVNYRYTGFFFEVETTSYRNSGSFQSRPWFFSWTFAVACVTIVGGSLTERTKLAAYPITTLVISLFVHPIMGHWIWAPDSWMVHVSQCGVLDYAGGSVVHLIGAWLGMASGQ
eukprot:jgi/Chrzof1/9234/Cz03g40260.t1